MSTRLISPRPATPAPLARGPVRPLPLLAGVALLATAVWAAARYDTGTSSVLLFALLPDVALLLAIGGSHHPGQLPRRAVPVYNVLHHPVMPLLVGAAALVGGGYWLVAAAAWAAHIAVDRGLGYGLRTRDGWQRG